MFEYIAQHWYVGVILAALILLTVFAWYKALSSSKKRTEEREKIIADLEREKKLRNEFRHIDETTFNEGKDDYRLIIGMCAFVQLKIEKASDMNSAFAELSQVKKNAYCLGYVFEDGKEKMSEFFRANGEPLLSASLQAVEEVIGGEFAEIFSKMFVMLDDNDETTSVNEEQLERWNDELNAMLEKYSQEIYAKVATYLRNNKNEFLLP